MELAGHVPGGAIKTERLKEIPAKESRDGSFAQSPLAEGLQRRMVGSSQLWGWSACREEHPSAAGGDQREPEHGDGWSGFVLAYCSLGPSKCLEHQLSPYNMGASESQSTAELISPWCTSQRGNLPSGTPLQAGITPNS